MNARNAHLGMSCRSVLEENFSLADSLEATCDVRLCVNQLHVALLVNMAHECQCKNVRKYNYFLGVEKMMAGVCVECLDIPYQKLSKVVRIYR